MCPKDKAICLVLVLDATGKLKLDRKAKTQLLDALDSEALAEILPYLSSTNSVCDQN